MEFLQTRIENANKYYEPKANFSKMEVSEKIKVIKHH